MKHKGFTLVEMLAVIAIIGILASMLAGAMVAVNANVKRAAIAVEIGNLSIALDNYKAKYGQYPPDGTDASDVTRHLSVRFPRSQTTTLPSGVSLNPSTALTFWLGGMVVNGRPIGFSQNPKQPFGTDVNTPRVQLDYEFNPEQLLNSGYQYTSKSGGAPYIYFKAKVANNVGKYGGKTFSALNSEYGTANPYKLKAGIWGAEKSYQIIHPGLDGMYSSGANLASTNVWRSSTDNSETSGNVTEGDLDNITNFTEGVVGDAVD